MLPILAKAMRRRPAFHHLENPAVMDIKDATGMNSFESMATAGETWLLGRPRMFVKENFGEEVASQLFSTGSNLQLQTAWRTSPGRILRNATGQRSAASIIQRFRLVRRIFCGVVIP